MKEKSILPPSSDLDLDRNLFTKEVPENPRQSKLSRNHFYRTLLSLILVISNQVTISKTKKTNLKIERGKSWLVHFLFVFHDWDNLVGRRGPHAWVEKVQSHGKHCRDKSGISAEIVSGKGLR